MDQHLRLAHLLAARLVLSMSPHLCLAHLLAARLVLSNGTF
jgi:hypothetical protein